MEIQIESPLLYLYFQRIQQANHFRIGKFRIFYFIGSYIDQISTAFSKILPSIYLFSILFTCFTIPYPWTVQSLPTEKDPW